MINKFKGEYSFLSNFEPVIIFWKGIKFQSVEHAYVASKSLDPKFWDKISKMGPKTAGKAKIIGSTITKRKDWKNVSLQLMEDFLRQKFSYERFKTKLLSTGNQYLEEGNYWHDNFYGNCICKDCSKIEGKNMLGKLLMKIREELKNESVSIGGSS
jgi:ribA/ribD-fused uncharacterized protein